MVAFRCRKESLLLWQRLTGLVLLYSAERFAESIMMQVNSYGMYKKQKSSTWKLNETFCPSIISQLRLLRKLSVQPKLQ